MANPFTSSILALLTALSLAAFGATAARLRRPEAPQAVRYARLSATLVALVGAAAAGLFVYRWLGPNGRWQPLAAHVDGLLLIAALFAGAIVFIQARPRLVGLSGFALPLLTLILAWGICASAWTYHPFDLQTLHPVWLAVHLTGVYLGTLSSALSAVAGGMYLFVQGRLKHKLTLGAPGGFASLETLEMLIVRSATLGFVLLTLGLASGVVILTADGSGVIGGYMPWKIGLAAAAWLVYAVLMNVRYATAFRGRRAAWLSIAGLVLLLATYGVVTSIGEDAPDARAETSGSATAINARPVRRTL